MIVFLIWGLTVPEISIWPSPPWDPLNHRLRTECGHYSHWLSMLIPTVNTHLVGLQTQWTPLITPKPCPPRRRARVTLQVTAYQRQHGQSKSLLSNLDRGHSLNTAVYQEVLNKKQKHLHCNKSGIYSKCPKNGFDRDNAGTQRRTLALKTFILRCLLRRHIPGENSSGVHM